MLVELGAPAREAVDRLVALAGVRVDDGSKAPTAWTLALAWLHAVNAQATVSSEPTATEIGRIADAMWVDGPWLPDGELDWVLEGATRTDAAGWGEAWRIPARTPEGAAVFVVVRDSAADPWRILSITR